MYKLIFFAIAVISIVSCHSRKVTTKTASTASTSTTESSSTPKPSITGSLITNEGQLLYKKNCGLCHELYEPTAFSVKKWEHEVPEMVEKANLHKNANISKEQAQKILAYVTSIAANKLRFNPYSKTKYVLEY